MPPRGRTRKRHPDGPVAIPIPSSFRKHHAQLSPFARSHLPPRMPVLGSVAKLQALGEAQLDELCEDVVVLLPLWGIGIPAHTLLGAQPTQATIGDNNAGSTPTTSPANTNPFTISHNGTPLHSLPGSGTNTPTAAQAIQVSVQTLPGVPPPSHHPSHGAQPPGGVVGGNGNPNHSDMRPPTEADAIALVPNIPLWLAGAPRKRNESRVKLARSFMAGFDGMKALVWDVTLELERRWPLREQEDW
ncbi:hypothetical protein MKZ38_001786 [Zalerion maritima]|uniref:Uncharacterized protein n=1 Tax=Zalerion maritima TaxID=339359 RepID=A0AAD5S5E3_9PEZI|nr:hypothetical protein MKZ38_001786 [Zalerion maritima]